MPATPALPFTGAQLRAFLDALNSGATLRDLLAGLPADDRLDAAAIKGLPVPLTATDVRNLLATLSGAARLDASAVKGIPPALTFPESRWTFADMLNTAAPFSGAAVTSGNITGATAAAMIAGAHPGVAVIRCGGTVNGGYRVYSAQDLRGAAGLAFRSVFYLPATPDATATTRIGLHDATTTAAPVDGAYVDITGAVLTCMTANNSVRSTGPTYTLAGETWYTLDIDYTTDSEVRFVLSNDAGAVLLDSTINTNVPNSTARLFLAQIIATSATASATIIGVDYMGVGPVRPGFVPRPS